MYGCDNWTIKEAECQRTDAFELWCWRRLLRVPWTTGRSNQSTLRKINLNSHWKDWCWSWILILWLPNVKSPLTGIDPDDGKTEGKRRRGWQRMRWLDGITDSIVMNLSKLWEIVKEREAWYAPLYGVPKSQTWLSNWATTIFIRWTSFVHAFFPLNFG